mgnify:CR=1 FL=1
MCLIQFTSSWIPGGVDVTDVVLVEAQAADDVAVHDADVVNVEEQFEALGPDALGEFDASFTGRKGFQSATRAGLPRFELDTTDAAGRLKVNPLADWSSDQIASYFAATGLSAHPLVAQGYPSIGCSPCTTMVAPGEDPRSGRWKGWDKTECGIHVGDAADELPPGYEPFL